MSIFTQDRPSDPSWDVLGLFRSQAKHPWSYLTLFIEKSRKGSEDRDFPKIAELTAGFTWPRVSLWLLVPRPSHSAMQPLQRQSGSWG